MDQFTFNLVSPLTSSAVNGITTSVIPWNDYGFSQRQSTIIDFGVGYANKTASFNINFFQNLDSVQAYLEDSATRVLCGDLLARGMNFYKLSIDITSYNGPAPDASICTQIIQSYIDALAIGEMFVVSDMMTKLRLNGIFNIKNPPLITFKKYTRDMIPVITGTVADIIDPKDRTNVFILENVATHSETVVANNIAVTL